jgi:hypothetical protein
MSTDSNNASGFMFRHDRDAVAVMVETLYGDGLITLFAMRLKECFERRSVIELLYDYSCE